MPALLVGDLGQRRQRLAVGARRGGGIADDVDAVEAGDGEVGADR